MLLFLLLSLFAAAVFFALFGFVSYAYVGRWWHLGR